MTSERQEQQARAVHRAGPVDPLFLCSAGILLGALLPTAIPWTSWAVLAAGLLLVLHRWLHTPLVGVVGVAVGLACAAAVPIGPALSGPVGLIGVRVGASNGRTGDLALSAALRDARWEAAEGRVRVRFVDAAPGPGSLVAVRGEAHPVDPALPGAPDPVRAARLAGVRTEIAAWTAAVVGAAPIDPIPAERDPTGLMRAILLGDRRGLDPSTSDVLRRTGTTHLLSISGFHVGAAVWMIERTLGPLLRLAALVRPAGVGRGPLVAAAIGGCWLYTALAQWPVPAERAAALLTVVLLARATGRSVLPARWLAFVAAGLALLDPSSPATASYQLSFGAMFGLLWFSRWVTRWAPPDLPTPLRWTLEALGATVGATLGTLPFAAWWFQAVPPLAPLANLVALPTLGLWLVPIAAGVAVLPSPMADGLAWLGTSLCRIVLVVLSPLAVDPWTPAVSAGGALLLGGAGLLAVWRPVAGLVLGALVLVAPPRVPAHLRITVLAVGQGDAALVEWPDGRRWLVDGGPGRQDVLFWLRRQRIRHLDRVVQTHPDRDHSRGLVAVVDELQVDEILARELHPDLAAAVARQRVPLALLDDRPGSDNDRSVAFPVGPVYFAGDLEAAGERREAAQLLPVPVLKVAHHGSRTSSTAPFLDRLLPAAAIISVGRRNPYGHPAPEVLARFEQRGITVFRTDVDGTVVIEVTPEAVTIRSWSAW